MSLWSRVANVFRSGRVDAEVDEEIQFHMEERIRELTAAGMTPEAAAEQAARRFGNQLRLREQSRDIKLMPWLDSIIRDVRFGIRMLRRSAAVSSASIASLALALGACLAAFSLIDALILRPLPVHRPGQLVYLTFPTYTPERPEADTFNDPLFVRLREMARGRVDLVAMSTQVMRPVIFADANGEKERLRTQFVSGDAFDVLGVVPAMGRLLSSRDHVTPGAHPVAVVSHAFWMRRFGGNPAILGSWFVIDDRQFQIIGVADARFTGVEPGRPTDLWLPYLMYNPRAFGNPDFGWFRILGRVRENVDLEQARTVLHATFTSFRRERARELRGLSPERVTRFIETPLYIRSAANGPSPLRREFERPLWILAFIAGFVLLIAGSNVANLFLARTAAREREMSLRLSIGAGRRRLIQQVLIESALLAAIACILGLLFAEVTAPSVIGMLAPADDPVHLDLRLDWRLAVFASGLALLTTALFGLAPALRASGVAPMTVLKAGGERSAGRAGTMHPFVALQVAFSLVVLFVGGLLVLSFARLSRVAPGFATADVVLVSVEPAQRIAAAQHRTALLQLADRLRAVPGVEAASCADYNPVGRAWTHYVRLPGRPHESIEATMAPVAAGFFETMGIPVVSGRGFSLRDMDAASAAIIVSESFATRYFGREPAVGRTLDARFAETSEQRAHEVIGVVADTRYDLRKPAAPTIYIPLRNNGTLLVRVAGDPAALVPRLREEVRAASPLFRVTSIRAQSAVVDQTLLRERLLALLSGFFALVGLALVAVGLHGVLSYAVVQRTREIGIRVALGARQSSVVRTVVAQATRAALSGAAAGLAGALYLSRYLEALLFEVRPLELWSLALPLGTLLLAALLGAIVPAFRAARVDPAVALRYE